MNSSYTKISLRLIPALLLLPGVFSCSHSSGVISPEVAAILADTVVTNPYAVMPGPAPDAGCAPLKIRPVGAFGKVFNDLNPEHLVHAQAGGIVPVTDEISAWTGSEGLARVESNQWYLVDKLTHSYPYLKDHARQTLDEIGRRFRDSLQARGGGEYRLKVTSLLRTPLTVGKLRRVNRNATSASAHQYATTFDISYSKFICDDRDATRRRFEDLKNLLAEVVYAMRAEGKILVKHERKQACFHITVTAPTENSEE